MKPYRYIGRSLERGWTDLFAAQRANMNRVRMNILTSRFLMSRARVLIDEAKKLRR